MAAGSLIGGGVPKSLTLVGTTLTLTFDTCCGEDVQVSVDMSSLGGGTGTFAYFTEEAGSAPGAPTAPATPPPSPSANDSLLEKWDDFLIAWTYDGGSWTEEWRIAASDILVATATPTANPSTWSTTAGRVTLIYNSEAAGTKDLLGVVDGSGNKILSRHPKYYEISNGPTGIGASPENPNMSEILAFMLGAGMATPLPGDIIAYTAPSGFVYIYDVRRDDASVNFEYRRRNSGIVRTTIATGGILPTDYTTWPSLAPQVNVIVNSTTGHIEGLVDSTGSAYRIPRQCRVELGKSGVVSTDAGTINDRPLNPLFSPSPGSWRVRYAEAVMSKAPTANTTFRIYRYSNPTATAVLVGEYTILAGAKSVSLAALVGTTFTTGALLASIVTSGSDGENLNIALLMEM